MAEGIAVVRDGHRTWLKWHRARRAAGDLPFTGARIIEGMKLGASVEVDLVRHADAGLVVLHDLELDTATTGSGPVAAARAATLRGLYLRDAAGRPTPHHPMLLGDLCGLIAAGTDIAPEAVLQLDLKEDDAGLDAATTANFATVVTPVARHFILSGGHPGAIGRLAAAVPTLPLGFDPCHEGAIERLLAGRDFAGFVAGAVAPFPQAGMIYLEYRLILFALKHGFDLIAAFHAAGKAIDAYTLRDTSPESIAIARQLVALRVDQITTDDPIGLDAALAG